MSTKVVMEADQGMSSITIPSADYAIAAGLRTPHEAWELAHRIVEERGDSLPIVRAAAYYVDGHDGHEYRVIIPLTEQERLAGSGTDRVATARNIMDSLENNPDFQVYEGSVVVDATGVRQVVVARGEDTIEWLLGFIRADEAAIMIESEPVERDHRMYKAIQMGHGLPVSTTSEELGLDGSSTFSEAMAAVLGHDIASFGSLSLTG